MARDVLLKLVERADSPASGEKMKGWANGLAKAAVMVSDAFFDWLEAERGD